MKERWKYCSGACLVSLPNSLVSRRLEKCAREIERLKVCCCPLQVGLDSAVGIVTHYGLNDPGIECRWGRDFPHPSRPALGSTQPPVQWIPGSFPRVNRPWREVDHPPPSSAEVERKAELYISPSGPSWPILE